jgi:hypothetical protein
MGIEVYRAGVMREVNGLKYDFKVVEHGALESALKEGWVMDLKSVYSAPARVSRSLKNTWNGFLDKLKVK